MLVIRPLSSRTLTSMDSREGSNVLRAGLVGDELAGAADEEVVLDQAEPAGEAIAPDRIWVRPDWCVNSKPSMSTQVLFRFPVAEL